MISANELNKKTLGRLKIINDINEKIEYLNELGLKLIPVILRVISEITSPEIELITYLGIPAVGKSKIIAEKEDYDILRTGTGGVTKPIFKPYSDIYLELDEILNHLKEYDVYYRGSYLSLIFLYELKRLIENGATKIIGDIYPRTKEQFENIYDLQSLMKKVSKNLIFKTYFVTRLSKDEVSILNKENKDSLLELYLVTYDQINDLDEKIVNFELIEHHLDKNNLISKDILLTINSGVKSRNLNQNRTDNTPEKYLIRLKSTLRHSIEILQIDWLDPEFISNKTI